MMTGFRIRYGSTKVTQQMKSKCKQSHGSYIPLLLYKRNQSQLQCIQDLLRHLPVLPHPTGHLLELNTVQ